MSDQRSGEMSKTAPSEGPHHSAETRAGNLRGCIHIFINISYLWLSNEVKQSNEVTNYLITCLGVFEDSHNMSDKNTQLVSALNVWVFRRHILMVPERAPLSTGKEANTHQAM